MCAFPLKLETYRQTSRAGSVPRLAHTFTVILTFYRVLSFFFINEMATDAAVAKEGLVIPVSGKAMRLVASPLRHLLRSGATDGSFLRTELCSSS